MTTPSGDITIGNVASELGVALPLTLGDSRARALASVPTGPITLGQLRNKSLTTPPPPPPPPPTPVYPARGTLLSQYCSSTVLVGNYADGMGGSYIQNIQVNSPTCGYVPPTPAGTLLNTYCSGTTKMGTFADGNYGTYPGAIQNNSTECGYVPPTPAGTKLYEYCTIYDFGGEGAGAQWSLMGAYADGAGGVLTSLIAFGYPPCFPGGGIDNSGA